MLGGFLLSRTQTPWPISESLGPIQNLLGLRDRALATKLSTTLTWQIWMKSLQGENPSCKISTDILFSTTTTEQLSCPFNPENRRPYSCDLNFLKPQQLGHSISFAWYSISASFCFRLAYAIGRSPCWECFDSPTAHFKIWPSESLAASSQRFTFTPSV
jgi:hypothetical protein